MSLMSTKDLHLQALKSLEKVAKPKATPAPSSTPKQSAPKKAKSTPKPKTEHVVRNVSIQHMSAAKPKLQNRLLYDTLNYLKQEEREVTVEELMSELPGYDFKSADVAQQLQMNPKIQFEDGKYSFKPVYAVKNINELHDLVNRTPTGVEVEQLKDSYKTVDADVKKLVEQKDIIVIRNEESKYDIIYPNYSQYRIQVSEEFMKMWRNIKTPDDVELEKQLKAAGISLATEEEVKNVKRPSSKKKEPRKRKMTKITNTHIAGLDLTKAYQAPPTDKK